MFVFFTFSKTVLLIAFKRFGPLLWSWISNQGKEKQKTNKSLKCKNRSQNSSSAHPSNTAVFI